MDKSLGLSYVASQSTLNPGGICSPGSALCRLCMYIIKKEVHAEQDLHVVAWHPNALSLTFISDVTYWYM